mgnify:CR=1 FL=1
MAAVVANGIRWRCGLSLVIRSLDCVSCEGIMVVPTWDEAFNLFDNSSSNAYMMVSYASDEVRATCTCCSKRHLPGIFAVQLQRVDDRSAVQHRRAGKCSETTHCLLLSRLRCWPGCFVRFPCVAASVGASGRTCCAELGCQHDARPAIRQLVPLGATASSAHSC